MAQTNCPSVANKLERAPDRMAHAGPVLPVGWMDVAAAALAKNLVSKLRLRLQYLTKVFRVG